MKINWDIYQYKTIPQDTFGTALEKLLLFWLSITENGVAAEKKNH